MMKRCTLFLLALIVMLQVGRAKENVIQVKAVNPLNLERKSETLAIRLEDIRKRLSSVNVERLVVIDEKTRAELLCQVTIDELLFQSDFKPNEVKMFLIRQSTSAASNVQSLVDGQFVLPREDYAWENDRVAFRMYGPALAKEVNNGIDVWTKRTRSLIVGKWYKGDEDTGKAKVSYHIDHGEGADFFSVGNTFGAGGSGIWHNNRVYQPGVFTSHKTIANGPIRVIVELTYDKWNVEGKELTEVKRISLDAGQNLNKIEEIFTGQSPSDVLYIACGLAKRRNATSSADEKNGWLSLWGPANDDPVNGSLGTGVVIPKATFVRMNEDSSQHLAIGKVRAGKTFTYFAGAGWTRSGDYATEDDWKAYLDTFAQRLDAPVRVSLKKK